MYIKNNSEERFRRNVCDKTLNMLVLPECLQMMEGLLIIAQAYMNSLVETEEQIEFYELSMGNVH